MSFVPHIMIIIASAVHEYRSPFVAVVTGIQAMNRQSVGSKHVLTSKKFCAARVDEKADKLLKSTLFYWCIALRIKE